MNIKAAKSVQGIAIQCIITHKRLTFKNNNVLYYQGMIFTVNDTDILGGKKELQALPKGSNVCSFHQLSSFIKFNYL